MDCKEVKPVIPKENTSWIFIERTDAEAEAPVLWPPDARNWLFRKELDARKDWREEEKGMKENEMFGWHHRLNGHEFEQALGVGDGQGDLVCCSPWDYKELDTTERLNWRTLKHGLSEIYFNWLLDFSYKLTAFFFIICTINILKSFSIFFLYLNGSSYTMGYYYFYYWWY